MKKLFTKSIEKDNPLYHHSPRMEALEIALEQLIDILEENADEIQLSEEDAEELSNVLVEAFIQRKASIILGDKLDEINSSVKNAISRALKDYLSKSSKDKKEFFDLYYYRNNLTHLSDD